MLSRVLAVDQIAWGCLTVCEHMRGMCVFYLDINARIVTVNNRVCRLCGSIFLPFSAFFFAFSDHYWLANFWLDYLAGRVQLVSRGLRGQVVWDELMLCFERGDLFSQLLNLDFMLVISFIYIADNFLDSLTILATRSQGIPNRFLLHSMQHHFDCITLIRLFLSFWPDLLLNKCSVLCSAIRTVVAGVASHFRMTVFLWNLLFVGGTVALGVRYCLRLISSVLVRQHTKVELLLLGINLVAVDYSLNHFPHIVFIGKSFKYSG